MLNDPRIGFEKDFDEGYDDLPDVKRIPSEIALDEDLISSINAAVTNVFKGNNPGIEDTSGGEPGDIEEDPDTDGHYNPFA